MTLNDVGPDSGHDQDAPLHALLELFGSAGLTPLQREISQRVLENSDELSYCSINEAATLLGVSAGSLSRFAHALSLDGYPALRATIREAVNSNDLRAPSKMEHWIDRAMVEQIQVLGRLRHDEHVRATLLRAAAAISFDAPLIVFGFRASEGFARSLATSLRKVHPDVALVTSADSVGYELIHQARRRGCRQALAIVVPRYPRESLNVIRHLCAEQMSVTLITGTPPPPDADHVDFALPVPVGNRLLFDLSAAALVIGHILVQAVVEANPHRVQQNLEDADEFETRQRTYR